MAIRRQCDCAHHAERQSLTSVPISIKSRVPVVRDFNAGCAIFSLDDIYAGAESAVRAVADIEVKSVPAAVFVVA